MGRACYLRTALVLCVLGAAGIALHGYVTDDTYIHLRYARHLVERGELSFNPGSPTYGCTSPLWVFGLAALLKARVPPLLAPRLLGWLAALAALYAFDALLAALRVRQEWRLPVLLLFAADAWFLRWTNSGMETPLATLLLLAVASPSLAGGGGPRATLPPGVWAAWGVAVGLAALTRPEFLLLGLLAWPWLAWRGERPRWRRAGLPAVGGGALVLVPWLGYAWHEFGRLTPATAIAKSYAPTLAPAVVASSLARSITQLGAVQAPLWLALLVLAFLGLRARRRDRGPAGPGRGLLATLPRERLVLAGLAVTWVVVLCFGYAVGQVWVISRYVSPLAPVLLLALVAVTDTLWPASRAAAGRGRTVVLLGGVLATLAVNGWLLVGRVRPHARDLARGIRECLVPTGEWLAAHTPPDARVAGLDIGVLGWSSERRIVDLAGLVSPELLAIGRERGFPAMVASGAWLDVVRPDWLVDRTDGPPRWDGRTVRGVTFTRVRDCVVPGLGVTEPQRWTVTLYRLDR